MKYKLGQIVFVRYKKYRPGVIVRAKIVATQAYQYIHYRPECFSYSYFCDPSELEGMEHDEGEWISEANEFCIPHIVTSL